LRKERQGKRGRKLDTQTDILRGDIKGRKAKLDKFEEKNREDGDTEGFWNARKDQNVV